MFEDLSSIVKELPERSGVYLMLDEQNNVLYVGKAKNLKKRVTSYFVGKKNNIKTQKLLSLVHDIQVTITRNEVEAYLLEINLIQKYKPRYNVIFRDDKTYPYILFTNEKFSQIRFYRGKCKKELGTFYGPYTSGEVVKESINTLQKVFQLRTCDNATFANRARPCLQYQIGRCSAPCVNFIDLSLYSAAVKNAQLFLTGQKNLVIDNLIQNMQVYSSNKEYELAAQLRDQIKLLKLAQNEQVITNVGGNIDIDIIGFYLQHDDISLHILSIREQKVVNARQYFVHMDFKFDLDQTISDFILQHYTCHDVIVPQKIVLNLNLKNVSLLKTCLKKKFEANVIIVFGGRGNIAKWLEIASSTARSALQKKIVAFKRGVSNGFQELSRALGKTINTVDCFDISHLQGTNTVGVGVEFRNSKIDCIKHKRYYLNDCCGDDYKALQLTLSKYYHKYQYRNEVPDLVLIDGGSKQVKVARLALLALGIETIVLGIVKGEGRKPENDKILIKDVTISASSFCEAFRLLQKIRDVTHNTAINSHRCRNRKNKLSNPLDNIVGVGKGRRELLLTQFGGLTGVLEQTWESLAKVRGISKLLAKRIYNVLHVRE